MHDEDQNEGLDELQARRKTEERTRGDWFADALGTSWVSEGDGIYRYVPEPRSLRVPPPDPEPTAAPDPAAPAETQSLEQALAPGARNDADASRPAAEGTEAEEADAHGARIRSLWNRR
jgi:hypothetical protein